MQNSGSNKTRRLAMLAITVALASAVHYLEGLLPPLIPALPGAKLGLANTFSLFALLLFGAGDAFAVMALRCLVGVLLLGGSVSGLIYALAGGITSWLIMSILHKLLGEHVSEMALSIAGAVGHNAAQVAVAAAMVRNIYVFSYLPWLLVLAVPTGLFVGILCRLCMRVYRGASRG